MPAPPAGSGEPSSRRSEGNDAVTIIDDADEPAAEGENVIDLMAALKKSVGEKKTPAKRKKSA